MTDTQIKNIGIEVHFFFKKYSYAVNLVTKVLSSITGHTITSTSVYIFPLARLITVEEPFVKLVRSRAVGLAT